MEVLRKSAQFISEINATPEKTGEYEPLRKDESTDSDDGNVNENVLFEHTKVNTGKRKCKRLVPTLCWIACIAVAILAVFTVVLYFTRSKTLANSLKKPHIKKPQPNKSFKLNKRFKKDTRMDEDHNRLRSRITKSISSSPSPSSQPSPSPSSPPPSSSGAVSVTYEGVYTRL
ncbi:hypothetical protein LSAT2_013378 [Lamellibrachia satsuma]|nr:hypothetical protein LSAT2_013378 [Lamellibrachia satsuma]